MTHLLHMMAMKLTIVMRQAIKISHSFSSGYAERSAGSQVNWAEIGKNLTDTLQEEVRIREEKKAAIRSLGAPMYGVGRSCGRATRQLWHERGEAES